MTGLMRLCAGAAILTMAAGAATAGPLPGSWGHGSKGAAGPIAKPMPATVPAGGGTQVPEPGDVFLFAAGVAGLIIGRRSSRMKPRG